MARFTIGHLKSPQGLLTFYSAQPWTGPPRPVVVFLHGLARQVADVAPWADFLSDVADVVLVDLPGHGKSDPIIPATLEALAAQVFRGLAAGLSDRQVILVGESLGALIALAIAAEDEPAPVMAVLAVDPPLTTRKLLHVHRRLQRPQAQEPLNFDFMKSLSREVFGLDGETSVDKIYYDIFEKLSLPIRVVTGDLNLLPLRNINGIPCVMDDVDRYVIEKFYLDRVEFRQLHNSGHLLLVDHPDWCRLQLSELAARIGIDLNQRRLADSHSTDAVAWSDR